MPDTFVEYFWKLVNILFFKLILSESIAINRNGIAKPKENSIKYKTPEYKVSDFDERVNNAPRTGPIHGVNPNPKVNPIIKFLDFEKLFISTIFAL